jgi:hypothetical protein
MDKKDLPVTLYDEDFVPYHVALLTPHLDRFENFLVLIFTFQIIIVAFSMISHKIFNWIIIRSLILRHNQIQIQIFVFVQKSVPKLWDTFQIYIAILAPHLISLFFEYQ